VPLPCRSIRPSSSSSSSTHVEAALQDVGGGELVHELAAPRARRIGLDQRPGVDADPLTD
jgi:hypothetical protein